MAIRKVTIRTRKIRKTRQGARVARRPLRPVTRGVPKRKTDYARVVEAQETPIVCNANGVYTLNFTTQLSDFKRAQEVAHAYKYYRCAKVELAFVPYATFAVTNGLAAARMPQMYFTLDRVNNMWALPNEAEMLERGVLPKLFKRNYKFSWKPNLLQHVQMETNQLTDESQNPLGIRAINAVNSIPLFNKWLPTQQSGYFNAANFPAGTGQIGTQVTQAAANPYALKYYGAVCVIDIEGGNEQQIGDLMVKVTWEFKSPRVIKSADVTGQIEPYYSSATSVINAGVLPNQQPSTYP